MSPPRRKPPRARRHHHGRQPRHLVDAELWRPVRQLGDPEPVRPATDPTALLRSLGNPPLPGQGAVAEHYLAAVVERAAGLATALAASAELLAPLEEPDG